MKRKTTGFAPFTSPACMTVAVAAAFAFGSFAQATTLTWDANGATAAQTDGAGAWKNANPWWDGAANVTWTSGDDAIFGNGGTGGAVTLASATAAQSITVNTFTGTYSLGTTANILTIGSGGITMTAGASAVSLVSAITLGGPQSWTNGSGSSLTVTNAAANAVVYGSNLLTLNGGSFNFALTGSATTTGAGGVRITAGSAVTNSSTVNPFGSGPLELNSGSLKNSATATTRTVSNAASITGNFTFDAAGATGNNTFSAAATTTGARVLTINTSTTSFSSTLGLGGNLTVQGTGTLSLGGVVSDGGNAYSVTKSDAGVLTLVTANTFTGGVTLNAGTLNIGNATAIGTGTLTINGGAINTNGASITLSTNNAISLASDFANTGSNSLNLGTGAVTLVGGTRTITTNGATTLFTIGGSIGDGGNNYGLTKAGTGTLVLSGANTYGGTTTVAAGTLQATNTGALPDFSTPGRVVVAGGATLTVNAGITGALFTSANLDSLRAAVTFGANSKLGIDTSSASFSYASTIADTAGGALGLLKQGTNTLTLSATNNTYSGGTFLNAGTLNFAALNTLGTGGITFNGGTLQYTTGNT
ncbi:MAG: hypothetical protein RLZZ214_1807, partial [Verrucomicrobiota bacterium]